MVIECGTNGMVPAAVLVDPPCFLFSFFLFFKKRIPTSHALLLRGRPEARERSQFYFGKRLCGIVPEELTPPEFGTGAWPKSNRRGRQTGVQFEELVFWPAAEATTIPVKKTVNTASRGFLT